MREDIGDVVKQTRTTYDHIAADYSAKIDKLLSNSWIGEFEGRLIDGFLSMLRARNPLILDIGCGNGKDTRYLQHVSVAIGIDISCGMLKEATKRVPDGDFCQMDMRNLGFSNGLFDGVWANGCIYHVPKTGFILVLEEIRRILKRPGIFSFNFKLGTGQQLEESPRSHGGSPRFYAYYTTNEMERLLEQNSFAVVKKQPYPEKIFDEQIVQFWARKLDSL